MELNPTYLYMQCLSWQGRCMENNGTWFLPSGRDMKFDTPVFYNGALHFITSSSRYFVRPSPFYKPYIMSYNLENAISTMLPREAIRGCHVDIQLGQSVKLKWINLFSEIKKVYFYGLVFKRF
ncbi:hypothetical protein TSUD_322220 [Trifolium subterraneum]|uniref:Uncharacterized protein n=1 Tax=Trifolium subterraneum TaxID=3900 RepID=A0A2Z6N516_TRISU|nr:hypothetical protein TSUD_322220 [Trifolium subterraneum]